jgi:hypothetical protein
MTQFVHEKLSPASIPIDERRAVPVAELDNFFQRLKPMEVLEVTGSIRIGDG